MEKDISYFNNSLSDLFPADISAANLSMLDLQKNIDRDIFLSKFYDFMQVEVFELGRMMSDYAAVIISERSARKKLNGLKGNKKLFPNQEKLVKSLFNKRSSYGSRIKSLLFSVSEGAKLLEQLSLWCERQNVERGIYYNGILRDFNNIIKSDIVRRRSLGANVSGGPKMLISFNASKIGAKCCRRLSSNLMFVIRKSERNFVMACEEYRSKEYSSERTKRCMEILKTCGIGLKVNSSLPAGIFYKATFAYLWKRFNEVNVKSSASDGNRNFDDKDIIRIMMGNGYSDAAIVPAVFNNSLYYYGFSEDKVRDVVKDCRAAFNREQQLKVQESERTVGKSKNNIAEKSHSVQTFSS